MLSPPGINRIFVSHFNLQISREFCSWEISKVFGEFSDLGPWARPHCRTRYGSRRVVGGPGLAVWGLDAHSPKAPNRVGGEPPCALCRSRNARPRGGLDRVPFRSGGLWRFHDALVLTRKIQSAPPPEMFAPL